MSDKGYRFYVVAPGGDAVVGFDQGEAALYAAREYGDGADVVDTQATFYHPMVQQIQGGEPVYLEYGAWDCRVTLDQSLIEAVKKGYPPIVQAFLAKGADPNAADETGGTALIWAVARRRAQSVRLLLARGADVGASDADGMTALGLARRKSLGEIAALLEAAGANE